jgi:hypothetical protein
MMKQLAQKTKALSLVPAEPRRYDSKTAEKASASQESSAGWGDAVAPSLLRSTTAEGRPVVADRRLRSLSFTDIRRVNQATVREGTDHRHWPPEVVLSFIAAEVIKRNK